MVQIGGVCDREEFGRGGQSRRQNQQIRLCCPTFGQQTMVLFSLVNKLNLHVN